MNEHVHAEPGKKQPSVTSGILQRKCYKCKKKRPLQRKTSQEKLSEAPPIAHEVLRLPGPPLDPANRAFTEPGIGHDFSRTPLHPPVRGVIQTKLAINAPGDKYEQEADRIDVDAEHVWDLKLLGLKYYRFDNLWPASNQEQQLAGGQHERQIRNYREVIDRGDPMTVLAHWRSAGS